MNKVTIDRELLERLLYVMDNYVTHETPEEDQLRAILAAPRQPEGDAASILLPALRQYMHNDGSGLLAGYEYERTQQIVAELREERDTLLQQLAERDATIGRLEAGIPRLQEQSFQMRQQMDKLAGLLRDERNWSCVEISCQRGVKDHCLCGTCRILRIDAALAEVK